MFVLSTAMLLLLVAAVNPCVGHNIPDKDQSEPHLIPHPDNDLNNVMGQLKSQMMDMKAHYDSMILEMKESQIESKKSLETEIIRLKEHYDGIILDVRNGYDAEIVELKEQYGGLMDRYNDIKNSHEIDVTELKERYDGLKNNFFKMEATYAGEIEYLDASHTEMNSNGDPINDETMDVGHTNENKDNANYRLIPVVKTKPKEPESKDKTKQTPDNMDIPETTTYDERHLLRQLIEITGGRLIDIGHDTSHYGYGNGTQGFAAFQAYLSTQFDGLDGDTIMYDDVRINMGGGYDPATGHFTAPTAGIYVINRSGTAEINTCSGYMCISLMVNGVLLSNICGEYINTAAKSELIQLVAGDDIWLGIAGQCTSLYGTGHHNSFSGYLLIETI